MRLKYNRKTQAVKGSKCSTACLSSLCKSTWLGTSQSTEKVLGLKGTSCYSDSTRWYQVFVPTLTSSSLIMSRNKLSRAPSARKAHWRPAGVLGTYSRGNWAVWCRPRPCSPPAPPKPSPQRWSVETTDRLHLQVNAFLEFNFKQKVSTFLFLIWRLSEMFHLWKFSNKINKSHLRVNQLIAGTIDLY